MFDPIIIQTTINVDEHVIEGKKSWDKYKTLFPDISTVILTKTCFSNIDILSPEILELIVIVVSIFEVLFSLHLNWMNWDQCN